MDQFDIDKTSTHGELFERARQCLLAINGMMETRKPKNHDIFAQWQGHLPSQNHAARDRFRLSQGREIR